MENLNTNYQIAQIISKEMVDELSSKEQAILQDWINESKGNKKLYLKIKEGKNKNIRNAFIEGLDLKEAWKKIEKEIHPQRKVITLKQWGVRIAAILLVGIIVGTLYKISKVNSDQPLIISEIIIEPGSSKAVLQLHNGETFKLEEIENDSIVESDGTLISNQGGKLEYKEQEQKETETLYNTVIVPVGGEYNLVLADGTKVWLNSDSKMVYPVSFNEQTRKVWAEGEVYFDIARNVEKPFIVDVNNVEIEVLGTEFNIEAYPEMNSVVTTLVEGSLKLKKETESVIIEPNQQAIIKNTENQFSVDMVDAKSIALWKDGIFYFEEAEISVIMAKLARWYNANIFYLNEDVKNKRFSVEVKKYKEIDEILNILSKTNKVQFDINSNNIIVRN